MDHFFSANLFREGELQDTIEEHLDQLSSFCVDFNALLELKTIKATLFDAVDVMNRSLRSQRVDLKAVLRHDLEDCHIYSKSRAVASLSMVLALMEREYIEEELGRPVDHFLLAQMGLAAMFMDSALASDDYVYLLTKTDALTPDDQLLIEKHPQVSNQILQASGLHSALVATIIQDHHRNSDGTGYPVIYSHLAQPSRSINILARVIKVADSYVSATSARVYREAMLPIEILYDLKESNDMFYKHYTDISQYLAYLKKLEDSPSPDDRASYAGIIGELRAAKLKLDKGQITVSGYKRRIAKTIPPSYASEIPIISTIFSDRVLNDRHFIVRLLQLVPPFSPQEIVTLATGREALVCGFLSQSPCRPSVKFMTDKDGNALNSAQQKTVYLNNRLHLNEYITHQQGREVRQFTYEVA